MKFEKWTVALAAAGLVSLSSATKADEKPSAVMTALSSTAISGYVDTSAQWNFGSGAVNLPPYKFGGPSKADGFNLDVVQFRIEKPLDETDEWAAGYRVDLWAGPDANTLGTQSTLATGAGDFAIRQAYIALRMPIGNGLDWKVGVFDSVIGYESVESPLDPNYTRSYGHAIEPQTHTGALASYRFNDTVSMSAGIADTVNPAINSRAQGGSTGGGAGFFGSTATPGDNAYAESYKAYMASIALTAPENMSFLTGSTLYAGVVSGYNNSVLGTGFGLSQYNVYVGGTMATPINGLRLGAAWDLLEVQTSFSSGILGVSGPVDAQAYTVAGYVSYQATGKLSFHARGEYADGTAYSNPVAPGGIHAKVLALTGTVQYDLWKNVLSRVELRWDHSVSGNDLFGGSAATPTPSSENAWLLAANIIYTF